MECLGDGVFQSVSRPRLERTQDLLDLRPSWFDRIQVGRVRWQVQQACAAGLNPFPHSGHLMGGKIVHDDHLARPKPGTQDLLHISQENVPIGGLGNGHRRLQTPRGQRGKEGERLPVALRRGFMHALALRSTTVVARHLGGGPALVQKDQPLEVYRGDLFPPGLPALLRLLTVLLLRVERLFLSRSPNCRTTTQIQPRLNRSRGPCSSRCCNSCRVKSGCRRICSRIHSRWAPVTRLRGPRRHCRTSISPVFVRRAEIFLAQLKLTRNRFAISSRVPSPASYTWKNFRRRSFEYGCGIWLSGQSPSSACHKSCLVHSNYENALNILRKL